MGTVIGAALGTVASPWIGDRPWFFVPTLGVIVVPRCTEPTVQAAYAWILGGVTALIVTYEAHGPASIRATASLRRCGSPGSRLGHLLAGGERVSFRTEVLLKEQGALTRFKRSRSGFDTATGISAPGPHAAGPAGRAVEPHPRIPDLRDPSAGFRASNGHGDRSAACAAGGSPQTAPGGRSWKRRCSAWPAACWPMCSVWRYSL